jgi:hypothetical protein
MIQDDPDLDFLPIPDPGYMSKKGTGSRIRILNTEIKFHEVTKSSTVARISGGYAICILPYP